MHVRLACHRVFLFTLQQNIDMCEANPCVLAQLAQTVRDKYPKF
jgi:hypothetical protein